MGLLGISVRDKNLQLDLHELGRQLKTSVSWLANIGWKALVVVTIAAFVVLVGAVAVAAGTHGIDYKCTVAAYEPQVDGNLEIGYLPEATFVEIRLVETPGWLAELYFTPVERTYRGTLDGLVWWRVEGSDHKLVGPKCKSMLIDIYGRQRAHLPANAEGYYHPFIDDKN